MKILICGLPGTGKTTLARELAPLLNAVVFDGDAVRAHYNLTGFSGDARVTQARRMRWLCEHVTASGNFAIASFICPTAETRYAFAADFTIWIDRNGNGKYPDTQAMWEDPSSYQLRVTNEKEPYYWAERAVDLILPKFQPMQPTALFVGRWQPFHEGHEKLIEEGLKIHRQVCIGVRYATAYWPFERIKARIDARMARFRGRYTVVPLPNITHVCHGRDVGWEVQQLILPAEIEEISGTHKRALIGVEPLP